MTLHTGFRESIGRGALVFAIAAIAVFATSRAGHALPGQVLAEQKISDTAGGFTGTLDDNDFFGRAVASLGDVDGDGVTDLAVGALGDDDGGSGRGAVWVLFLNADGTVKSHTKISSTSGGFVGSLDDGDGFGAAVAGIGDFDGDNIPDLAVGATGDDDGGAGRGAVWLLFLNADGTVKSHAKISSTVGGFGGSLDNGDAFGSAIASLRDLDGDGVTDIAVGAIGDDDGGSGRGAVWILFLAANGTVASSAKLSDLTPGISGSLDNSDTFGAALALVDDLDGDGVRDLAVGAPGDDDGGSGRGAVYVVFLTASGTVAGLQKISDTAGGFTGILDDSDAFGTAVVEVRDLNGDGVNDLIVGAPLDDNGGVDRGAAWVLFMNSDGTVASHRKISSTTGNFVGPLDDGDLFGTSLTTVRDLDGDGIADIVSGAQFDDDGGSMRGAAWVLFLDGVPGAFCGDGFLDPGEQCDDGNTDPGDCCSPSCVFDSAGASCANGDVCDGDETCDGAGNCLPGTPLVCDDGDLCTQDLCDPISGCVVSSGPATACLLPGVAKLDLKDKSVDAKDVISWKWKKGEETLLSDFGQPETTTSYALCVYDGVSGAPLLATQLAIPPSTLWRATGTRGFKYRDTAAGADGVRVIVLKAGPANKAKVQLKAKGANIPMPAPASGSAFFEQNPSVIVQLLNSEGLCWSSEFVPPAKRNLVDRFKDTVP